MAMTIRFGEGQTTYGPGVQIDLTGSEVATAIDAYLVAHGFSVDGPRTVKVNGKLCQSGEIYIDPSGSVVHNGIRLNGSGKVEY
jgi:hypothetical protein